MTILEAAATYGLKVIKSSVNDDLTSIVDRVYSSRDDVYFQVIRALNNRFDWECIEAGSIIRYIPKTYCSEINETIS